MALLIGFLVGAAVVGGVIWYLLNTKNRAVSDELRASEHKYEAERTTHQAAQVELSATKVKAASAEKLEQELAACNAEIDNLEASITVYREERTRLEAERQALEDAKEEQKKLLEVAENQLRDAFKALSSEALSKNNESFMELAKKTLELEQEKANSSLKSQKQAIEELVKPLNERLGDITKEVQKMEEKRAEAYGNMNKTIEQMVQGTQKLGLETRNLVQALRQPVRRGQWGEIQLRRVAELAGMIQHCDFEEQVNRTTEDGKLRPDMIVHMPSERIIVVDAKTAMEAYIQAVETEDEEIRRTLMMQHANHVREHIKKLSSKDYAKQFASAPDFVVMFLPGDPIFSAALEQDPSLIEFGADNNVIIATPTTLIAILRAIAYGWRQFNLEKDAQKIAELGVELYERFTKLGAHIAKLGRQLDNATEAYNNMVGSLERTVLPSARRMKELPGFKAVVEVEEIKPVTTRSRTLRAPDMPELPFGLED